MTARYFSAATVSTGGHALVIALLLVFSLQSKTELISKPFIIESMPAGQGGEPVGRQDDKRIVFKLPPRSVVQSAPEVVQEAAPVTEEATPATKPHPAPRHPPTIVAPPRPPEPSSTRGQRGPRPIAPAPVAPPRVGTEWSFKDGSSSRNGGQIVQTQRPSDGANGARLADERERYFAQLRQKVREALDLTPAMAKGLVAHVEFRLGADGTLSRPKILRSSGNPEFDRAVLEAVAHTRMPPPPGGLAETLSAPVSLVDSLQ